MKEEYLLLDSSIRDWVVIPIILILLLVGIGRHYIQELIKSKPKVGQGEVDEIRYKQTLMQSNRLRMQGQFINSDAFNTRKAYFLKKKTGVLREKVTAGANPMGNPLAMVDMMKGNVTNLVPNIALMTFVGYFFSGFVCLKLPFPVPSNHFRSMFQRGVDLSTLNISYVSSLSWYFLVTFGVNGLHSLILDNDDIQFDQNQMMQMQMGMGMMGGPPQAFDATAAYRQERDALNATMHNYALEHVERRLLGDRYPDSTAPAVDLSKFK